MSCIRNSANLNEIIKNFIDRNNLTLPNTLWEIRKSPLGGFGVFAKHDIEVGQIIFKDHPVILGPRAAFATPLCVVCYQANNLTICKCGLYICSNKCKYFNNHQNECVKIQNWQQKCVNQDKSDQSLKLFKVLSPIRSLFLDEKDKNVVKYLKAHQSRQHGVEVEIMKNELNFNLEESEEKFMYFVCCVLDSNAFEVVIGDELTQASLRGLYPLSSLVNHCCSPNAFHIFDDNRNMIVRAAMFIPKDTEIFHSYSRLIWGTNTRKYHLCRTKHFICKCLRCEDPTEFGTYMDALLCKVCKGNVVFTDLNKKNNSKCELCGHIYSRQEISTITSLLGSVLNSFAADDLMPMLRFIENKLPNLVSNNNEVVVEVKYRIIWILGHSKGFTWHELSDDLLEKKFNYCNDLIKLLKQLRLGQCKMKGLLLYELYCCYQEKLRRNGNLNLDKNDLDLNNLLKEAADILMFDVTAPVELKYRWTETPT